MDEIRDLFRGEIMAEDCGGGASVFLVSPLIYYLRDSSRGTTILTQRPFRGPWGGA